MSALNTLRGLRSAGCVRRYHTEPGIEQTNAEHHWGVATLLLFIEPTCSRDALVYALRHDVAEYATGDMPAPTKWRYPDLKKMLDFIEVEELHRLGLEMPTLTEYEKALVKFCDSAELVLTCDEWQRRGNAYAYAPGIKVLQRMGHTVHNGPLKNHVMCYSLFKYLEGLYREHSKRQAGSR